MNNSSDIQCKILICLILTAAILFAYGQVQNHDFVNFDDHDYVTENRHIQKGLKLDSVIWAFAATRSGNWHPLTWLSHILDYRLYGKNPGGHHLTSLLFHIANTLLLFFVFGRMTNSLWQSGFVAALFALHPLHVESVAWVSERKDVLSTFFWMLTMWSYIRYVEHPTVNRYLLVVFFFTSGLMSKPMLVTLPLVLLLMDYWPLNRLQIDQSSVGENFRLRSIALRLVWEKSPLFVIAIASCIITFFVEDVRSLDVLPLKVRITNALASYANFIGKMIYPSKLAVLYPHPGMLPWWKVAGASLILGSISFLAIRVIKQSPYFAVGGLWYVGTLVPVIGLVQIGRQSMADRYTYIPLIGLFIIIAWGIPELVAQWRYKRMWLPAFATIFIIYLMAVTWKQVGYWENSITLFEHTLKVTANNYVPHNNLGLALYNQGRTKEAVEHYLQALKIKPDYVLARNNLGTALANEGKLDEAIFHYEKALRAMPDNPMTLYNIGRAFYGQENFSQATYYFKEVLRYDPEHVGAHNNLAIILSALGELDEAFFHYNKALQSNPENADIHYNLGNLLMKKGKYSEAKAHFTEALVTVHFAQGHKINPEYANIYNKIGLILVQRGKLEQAGVFFLKAIEIDPEFDDARRNLDILKQTLPIQ